MNDFRVHTFLGEETRLVTKKRVLNVKCMPAGIADPQLHDLLRAKIARNVSKQRGASQPASVPMVPLTRCDRKMLRFEALGKFKTAKNVQLRRFVQRLVL
jgi:hypothetical protein